MAKRKKKFHSLSGCEKAKLNDANIADEKTNAVDCNRCISIIQKAHEKKQQSGDVKKSKGADLEVVAGDGTVMHITKCSKAQLIKLVQGAYATVSKMDADHKQAFADQEGVHDGLIDEKVEIIKQRQKRIEKLYASVENRNIAIGILIVGLIASFIF